MQLDLRGELEIGGAWVDATGNILKRQLLTHTRGRQDQGSKVDPATCKPLINNTDGRFSPDNPRSPYYEQFGRNSGFRVSVRVGSPALELPGNVGAHASTPDHASLDITGDLDVRVDATLFNWLTPAAGSNGICELIAKMGFAGGTKSWLLGTRNDRMYFRWSADGTNNLDVDSTAPLPISPSGRMALRVTMDVDNGSGGRAITFYTATRLVGTDEVIDWVQLGDSVIQAGTTSIFNSASAVKIGDATDIALTRPTGRVHGAEILNGISGSVVANPDFTAQTIGAASFVDDAGRTWTMNGGTSLTNRRTRLAHEMAAYPTRWHSSGKHVWVDATTAGILRRLRRGGHALDSTLRRRIPAYSPLAYWPNEEGENATQAASPIPGVVPLRLTHVNWAQADSLASSNPLPVLASSGTNLPRLHGSVPAPATTLTSWAVHYIYRLDTANTTLRTFMRILSTGTVAEWYIQQRNDLTRIIGLNGEGGTVFTQDIATGAYLYNDWLHIRFNAVQNGGNVDWGISWFNVGGQAVAFGASFAGTVGRPTGVASPPEGYSSDLDGMALGHISVWPTDITSAYSGSIDAWTGETAGARMQRLADEENLPLTVCGVIPEQTQVGPQRPDAVLALLEEAEAADGGILFEDRERPILRYRDRAGMYNQEPVLVLDYEAPGLATPLEPTGDDDATVNDVTVSKVGGSSARAVLEEGRLSIQAPPNGVGTGYDTSVPLNLHSDEQTEPIAYWQLHLGTYEGRRYPQVRVMVHKAPGLVDQILAVDVGDKIVIKNPPPWLPPEDVELLVQGYTEEFDEYAWDITFNCSPGAPWNVGVVEDPVFGRVDTDGSELTAAVDADDTALMVFTERGPWTSAYPSLTVNPDFEEDLTGWSALGGVQVRVPAPKPKPFEGDWSLFFVPDGVSQFPNSGSGQVAVVVGRQYVASGWLRCSTTRSVALNVNWFGAGGAYQATDANDLPVNAGVWTWFEKTVTAPVGAVTGNLACTVADFPPSTDVLWVHQATLRPAGGVPQDFPFPIKAGGEEMEVSAITPGVLDPFTRTTTPGWGTPDIGAAWVSSGGAGGDHYTQGAEAAHQLTNVDVARLDLTPVSGADFDVQADIATAALAAGGPQLVSVVARAADGDNTYMAQLSISTTQTITLTLRKRVAGVETQLATFTTSLVHSAFAFFRVRFQVIGTQLRARVWSASAPDPRGWQVTATDSSLTAGSNVGLRSVRQTANSNANLVVSFDNVQLLNPQRFIVGRAVNGISKGHAAGTDVRLAYPTIVAL